MYQKKTLEELNVLDNFLISALAADQEVGVTFCKTVLSVLLEREIGDVRVHAQKFVSALTPTTRGIRMDVEVKELRRAGETGEESVVNVYDIEPHLKNDIHLERHNRFYQAKVDAGLMKSGTRDFDELPGLYVLTITDYDPFGYDYMMYRVRNQCREVPELYYDDGVELVYFYTGGTKGGSPEIKAMLNYLHNSVEMNVKDAATQRVHECVRHIKDLSETRDDYMTVEKYFEARIDEVRDDLRREVEEDVRRKVQEENRREIREESRREVLVENILELLSDYGEVLESVGEMLLAERSEEKLKMWLKLAARVTSVEEFEEKMQ